MEDYFRFSAIIIPLLIIETSIYNGCVVEAIDRSVYQKYSEWRKGGPNPARELKEKKDYFEKLQYQNQKKKNKLDDNDKFC